MTLLIKRVFLCFKHKIILHLQRFPIYVNDWLLFSENRCQVCDTRADTQYTVCQQRFYTAVS